MSELARCAGGGFLVGPAQVMPEDPADHQWPDLGGAGAVVGCNHLVCQRCQQPVVQAPGFDATRELKKQRAARLPAVYAACAAHRWSEEVQRGALEEDARVRLYLCRCALHGEMRVSPVEDEPDGPPGGPSSWRCAGHPRAAAADAAPADRGTAAPAAEAAEASETSEPSEAFVAAALAGQAGGPEAIDRRYHLTADAAEREALGEAVLAQLTSPLPRHRLRALEFFSRNPLVPQAAHVAARYADISRGATASEGAAASDAEDLASAVHELLADRLDPKRGFPDATAARAALREALLGGAPLPARALARLASFDQAWLAEHAAAAIAASPLGERTGRAAELTYALRALGLDASGRRTDDAFAELLRRAAAIPGVDRDELRQHLIEATGGTTAELIARALPR